MPISRVCRISTKLLHIGLSSTVFDSEKRRSIRSSKVINFDDQIMRILSVCRIPMQLGACNQHLVPRKLKGLLGHCR